MSVDLTTTLAGVKFLSPIGVASHAPKQPFTIETLAELYLEYVKAGAAYIHTPCILNATEPRTGRFGFFYRTKDWGPSSAGLITKEIWRPDEGLKLISILKRKLPKDVRLIGNIMGTGAEPESWVEISKQVEGAGVDLIELDISCSFGVAELGDRVLGFLKDEKVPTGAGVLLGDTPELVCPVIQAVGKKVSIPVGAKLAPETGFPRLLTIVDALKSIPGGRGWVSCINAFASIFAPPDIYNEGKSCFQGAKWIPWGGIWGEQIRAVLYRDVAMIAKYAPGIDIAAIGGLMKPEYMIEAMMLGAKLTEVSSGLLMKGMQFIRNSTRFLERYLEETNYGSVSKVVGKSLEYVGKPFEEIPLPELVAQTDASKCTGCKICIENLCPAGYIEDEVAHVRLELCSGCGLCVANCPTGARSLIPR